MEIHIKNFPQAEVVSLQRQIACQTGQVVSKTLVQNPHVSITLFAFDKGEEISAHTSRGDALVQCLEGTGRITLDEKDYTIQTGEGILMPAGHPHAVYGVESFKMLLTVVS